jgi:hypothetical protein
MRWHVHKPAHSRRKGRLKKKEEESRSVVFWDCFFVPCFFGFFFSGGPSGMAYIDMTDSELGLGTKTIRNALCLGQLLLKSEPKHPKNDHIREQCVLHVKSPYFMQQIGVAMCGCVK